MAINNPSGSLSGLSKDIRIGGGGSVLSNNVANYTPPASMKVTTAPTSPVTKTPVGSFGGGTKPVTTPTPSVGGGAGGYKGVSITPGSDADVAEQVRLIDAGTPRLTSTGSVVTTNTGGDVTSPTTFRLNTDKVTSDSMGSRASAGDVSDTRKSYFDYVQGLSEAMQYSPEYLKSYEELQGAKARDAEIQNNFYTGKAPGSTVSYAQGATQREMSENELVKTRAAIEVGVQELVRQGNIEGAKALVTALAPMNVAAGSSLIQPTGETIFGGTGAYADKQAQDTYFNLSQTFPDASIPAYDTNLTPQQNLQRAQGLASQSPSFASRNLIQVTDPSGAIYFVQKNQLQTNADGSYTFVNPGTAANQAADKASLGEQVKYRDTIERSVNTADANFKLIIGLMQKAKINDAKSPLINQFNNRFQAGVIGSGDVAAYRSSITALRQEYAQVLARGGQVTNEVRGEAERLIPENLSLEQLKKVEVQLRAEGQNIINEAKKTIEQINGRLTASAPIYGGGGGAPSGGGASGGGGGLWDW